MGESYKDEDTLRRLYLEENMTQAEVAEHLGVTQSKIQYWIKKHDISKELGAYNTEPYKDEEELRRLYLDENLTQDELNEHFDLKGSGVQYWVNKFGIEKDQSAYSTGPPVSEAKLRKLYWEDGLSQTEIGDKIGYDQVTIKNWMDYYRIESRGPEGNPEPPASEEELRKLYVDQGLGTRPIAEKLECSRNRVSSWLDRFGIEKHPSGNRKRDQVDGELLEKLYIEDGLTETQIASHLDIDVDQSTVSVWLRDLGVEMKNQAGWGQLVETKRGETVKSALEADVANWFYERNIDYVYEPDVSGTSYVPDFQVGEKLIEAWGVRFSDDYDERRENKIEKYEQLRYTVISVFHALDDRPGVEEVLPNVAWQMNSQTGTS